LKTGLTSPTNLKDVYNPAFGEKDHSNGQIDDTIISNNDDSEKVLATVVATIYAFPDKYPDAYIYAKGNKEKQPLTSNYPTGSPL
jgi:hypothetical protein